MLAREALFLALYGASEASGEETPSGVPPRCSAVACQSPPTPPRALCRVCGTTAHNLPLMDPHSASGAACPPPVTIAIILYLIISFVYRIIIHTTKTPITNPLPTETRNGTANPHHSHIHKTVDGRNTCAAKSGSEILQVERFDIFSS